MITYREILNEKWTAFKSPRDFNAPTVISAFAGCGGSSLGYGMAGFRELLAIEWDKHAAFCFENNFHDVPIYCGDIGQLTVDECMRLAGLSQKGELDIFDGSPPCQGFSTAGKRKLNDNRNQLFREYVRLLKGLMPRVFVMENVSGLVKGKMRLIFAEILKELKDTGYNVRCQLLNASHFGVPQRRERVIFIGTRSDLNIEPTFPEPFTYCITARSACFGADESGTPILDDSYGKLWSKIPSGKNAAFVLNGKGFNGCAKINPERPAPTIPKFQGGSGFGTIVHWRKPRAISIGEAKRLQSFPDQFILSGKYQDQWARIGNSVPPLLMATIADHIKKTIFNRIT